MWRAVEPLMIRSNNKFLLVVVAKAPEPQKVKTRLSPELSPDEATRLYRCFIQDRIKETSLIKDIDLAISYTPANSKDFFIRFLFQWVSTVSPARKQPGRKVEQYFYR